LGVKVRHQGAKQCTNAAVWEGLISFGRHTSPATMERLEFGTDT